MIVLTFVGLVPLDEQARDPNLSGVKGRVVLVRRTDGASDQVAATPLSVLREAARREPSIFRPLLVAAEREIGS